jgi:hypothetical protein
MTKLKLTGVSDDKPVKLAVELAAPVHRDLIAYADLLGKETGEKIEPAKLVSPMLARFMATDRGFAKARKGNAAPAPARASDSGIKGRASS